MGWLRNLAIFEAKKNWPSYPIISYDTGTEQNVRLQSTLKGIQPRPPPPHSGCH